MRIIRRGVCSHLSDAFHMGMFPRHYKENT